MLSRTLRSSGFAAASHDWLSRDMYSMSVCSVLGVVGFYPAFYRGERIADGRRLVALPSASRRGAIVGRLSGLT